MKDAITVITLEPSIPGDPKSENDGMVNNGMEESWNGGKTPKS